jgi:acyl carrier protein
LPGPSDPADDARQAALLADVEAMLTEIIGEDEMIGIDVTPEASLAEDIELESIEFVTLAERITERYGDRVDLIEWLAGKELDDLIALTVGEVVAFLAASGAGAPDPEG